MTSRPHLQRRTILTLSSAQILSGVAAGSVVSVGSLLAVELSGAEAWAGSITTASTLGAAIASLGLARLALAKGRRWSLTIGLLVALVGAIAIIAAASIRSFPLLIAGGALMGVGSAVNLQTRFAATDLSTTSSRARDLSVVVWMSTIGAVLGPNLVGFGAPLSRLTGLPELGAVFLFSAIGMAAALLVIWFFLRPDPIEVARTSQPGTQQKASRPQVTLSQALRTLGRYPKAIAALIGILVAHAVMVAVMSMTPVHMDGHGASVSLVGLTVSLHIAGMYAAAPLMGWLADRRPALQVLLAGLALLIVAVAVSGFAGGNHGLVTLGLILLGLGWSAATVAGSSIIAGAVPGDERVAIQGLSDSWMSFAGAGGGALAGVTLAVLGYGGLNAVAAGLAIAGICGVLYAGSRPAKTKQGPTPSVEPHLSSTN